MSENTLIIFTRTPLHIGAGSSVGAIDQPVMRERHTGFPIIQGSSIKGVLRDALQLGDKEEEDKKLKNDFFGKGDNEKGEDGEASGFTAGKISFGEAKLLLFPLRSAKGAFALATCPLALNRFARDSGRNLTDTEVADGECLANSKIVLDGKKTVVLEEYCFNNTGDFPPCVETILSSILDDVVLKEAVGRFVLLSDGDFAHFAMNACQVEQHVRINNETGVAQDGGLFNAETVPSESLFFSSLTLLRKADEKNPVFEKLSKESLIQFGGDGSTGLGFCTVKLNTQEA
jgi:CRISPR-associated protein Cmr4